MQKDLEFSLKRETERVVTELKGRHDQPLGKRADRLRNILEQFCASELLGASAALPLPAFLIPPPNSLRRLPATKSSLVRGATS